MNICHGICHLILIFLLLSSLAKTPFSAFDLYHYRSRDNEVSLLTQQVSQLKKYIGESEQARSVELWKQELEAVRAKNKVTQDFKIM